MRPTATVSLDKTATNALLPGKRDQNCPELPCPGSALRLTPPGSMLFPVSCWDICVEIVGLGVPLLSFQILPPQPKSLWMISHFLHNQLMEVIYFTTGVLSLSTADNGAGVIAWGGGCSVPLGHLETSSSIYTSHGS